ncbi:MAG: radical SAM/SPASM domain-containing protein [bacterium]
MFKRVYIEISNICNLSCSFCPKVKREKKDMSVDDFEKILKQVSPLTEEICLHLMGEPLTHPALDKIIHICESHGTKVQLTTNGILIDEFEKTILDSKAIRQINFSIQSFQDNFPDKDFDGYLLKIMNFCLKATKERPEMYINLRLWNSGEEATDNEKTFVYLQNLLNIKINRTVDIKSIKSKKIWNNVYLHFDSRFEWPSLDLPIRGNTGTCHGMIGHFGILVDGTVVPCCLDKDAIISLGNCLKEELQVILNRKRPIKIVEGFRKGILEEELCKHCSYIQRFSSNNKN